MKVPDPGADGRAADTAVLLMSPLEVEERKVVILVTRDWFKVAGLRAGYPLILHFSTDRSRAAPQKSWFWISGLESAMDVV